MAKYEIIPLVLGSLETDKSTMMMFMECGTKINVPIVSFYIKGAKKNILVDTGCPADVMMKCWPAPASDTQSFEEALEKLGLKPEDIDIVIHTHLHFDHCGNTSKCTNAKVVVQEDELKFALAPHPLCATFYVRNMLERLNFQSVKGDTEIVEGVKVLHTPGHTPGAQSVAIETAKGTAIITGFCSIRETFEVSDEVRQLFPSWFVYTPGINTNALEAFDSALKVKGLADILIPLHDLELGKVKKIP
jgi:glyoxylase-like metal-dependent hydrolase (beta-lactamase superfamily II)